MIITNPCDKCDFIVSCATADNDYCMFELVPKEKVKALRQSALDCIIQSDDYLSTIFGITQSPTD